MAGAGRAAFGSGAEALAGLPCRRADPTYRCMENEKPTVDPAPKPAAPVMPKEKEFGGPAGPEPTRYGDWEQKGRCTDF